MSYDLMLLADPGPVRENVLTLLESEPDVRPDPSLDNRYWLSTPHGEAQINIGTKDPVESVHVEFDPASLPHRVAVATRCLELAERLGMYVEDVQWGHELTRDNFPRLQEHWKARPAPPVEAKPAAKPWWKVW